MAFPAIGAVLSAIGRGFGTTIAGISGAGRAATGSFQAGWMGKSIGKPGSFAEFFNNAGKSSQSIQQFSDSLAKFATPVTNAISIFGLLSKWAAFAVNQLSFAASAMQTLGNAVGMFTGLSNPAQLNIFNNVMRDTMAALGRSLEPLMYFIIKLTQSVGDMYAKCGPIIERFVQGFIDVGGAITKVLGGAFGVFINFFGSTLEAIAEPLGVLVSMLIVLNPLFIILGITIATMVTVVSAILLPIKLLMGALGIKFGKFDPNATSKGAAAKNFEVSTSVDEMQRKMATDALSSGTGKKQEDVPNILDEILKTIKDFITNLPQKLKDAAVDGVKDSVPGAGMAMELVGFFKSLAMK